MKLEVNLSKKVAIPLLVSILVLAATIGVIAFGTNSPQTFGHSASELAPPAGCQSGQVLTFSGGTWTCSDSAEGGVGSSPLVCEDQIWSATQSGGTYSNIDVPAECNNGNECLLIMRVPHKWSAPVLYRQLSNFGQIQYSAPGSPWYALGSSFVSGENGRQQENVLVPTLIASVTDNGLTTLTLYDDRLQQQGEDSPNQWTMQKSQTGFGDLDGLYLCH